MEEFKDFETERVQPLTFEQLCRTSKEKDVHGKPIMGIYHCDLIKGFVDEAKSLNYDVEIYDMFAANNKDKRAQGVVTIEELEDKYGKGSAETYLVRRVFTNMRLKNFDTDELTTNMAISFHQQGIQVGFGNMVQICHNQQMLHADMYASTYAEKGKRGDRMDLDSVIQTAFGWLRDARDIVMVEREKMEKMKRIQISIEETLKFIGLLTATRVAVDSKNKSIHQNVTFPLNNSQINEFTESILVKHNDKKAQGIETLSVFDLYDSATDLYKANRMEVPNILPQNRAMVRMLDEQFAL